MNETALFAVAAALLGSMLFFAAVVAPTVFHALDADAAGRYLRALFPRYYAWGLGLALLGLALAWPAGPWALGLFALLVASFAYARQVLLPAINTSRDAGNGARFRTLHRRSVLLNGAQMLGLLALCAWTLAR